VLGRVLGLDRGLESLDTVSKIRTGAGSDFGTGSRTGTEMCLLEEVYISVMG
jgi:hypothetical protein